MTGKEISTIQNKKVLLDILIYFDTLCRKYNINYSLGYGTLLGAARHSGFIPWDDDIDVIMPQNDYLRFINLPEFCEQTSNSRYQLHCSKYEKVFDELYAYPFAKLEDSYTEAVFLRTKDSGGAYIDIFPVTGLPNEKNDRKQHFQKTMDLQLKINIAVRRDADKSITPLLFLKNVRRAAYRLNLARFRSEAERLVFSHEFEESDFVAVSVWNYGEREILPKSIFNEYCELSFEGFKFFCVKEYTQVLTKIYGDWEKLPPKDAQVAHHEYNLFWK